MGLFNKKKEETKSCCCGGSCTPETMKQAEAAKAPISSPGRQGAWFRMRQMQRFGDGRP